MSWQQLRHHAVQSSLWTCKQRFSIVVAGRGSGKTELARRRCVRYLGIEKPWVDPKYFYALPTYAQAKRVAWEPLKALSLRHRVAKISESELSIQYTNGSKLFVVGLDAPERVEGTQWDGGVIDEMSDQRPKVFDLSIRPALSHRNGWCWMIGVPKRMGIGAGYFKHKFHEGEAGLDEDTRSYTWSSEDILSAEEILSAKRQLDAADYEEQYLASWLTVRGVVYHAFSEVHNVTDMAVYNPNLPIIVGQDFNVDPMSWCLCHPASNGLIVFDEVRIKNTNTMASLNVLWERYKTHRSRWVFMGDASGQARKTSASATDYIQIKDDSRFKGQMAYTSVNPPVKDRNAAVNALLCNALGERRVIIHPRCKSLINDLNHLSYKPGTTEISLGNGMGHMSDAFGYIVYNMYPIRSDQTLTTSMVTSG